MEELPAPPEEKKLPAPEEKLLRPPTFSEKYGKFRWLILCIILILIFIPVSLSLNKTSMSPQSLQPNIPRPLPTPLPTPTADPTENWKTYKAKDYDFEVKYPADWFILPFSSTVENVHIPLVIANVKLEGREFPKESQIEVNFYVFEDKFDNLDAFARKNGLSPLDVERKVKEQNDLIGKYLTEEARITTEDIVVNQSNTYLNDNQAIKQEIECKKYCTFLDSKGLEISYYILHNNTFYKIWAELPSRDSTLITIYEKILSTFKFTQ